MNKKDLTALIARKTGTTQLQSAKTIDAIFASIIESLEKGETISIREFGSFSIVRRAERNGVNPMTRKSMIIPARNAVKFIPSAKIVVK